MTEILQGIQLNAIRYTKRKVQDRDTRLLSARRKVYRGAQTTTLWPSPAS